MLQPSPLSPTTTLLEQLRERDEAAWQCLTQVVTPVVYRWVRRGGVPESNAPDVVQDVFVEVSRSLHRFQREAEGSSFTGWLRTITRRRVIHYHRQDNLDAVGGSTTQAFHEQVPAPSEEDDFTDDPKQEMLLRVLDLIRDQFEPRTWQAFEALTLRNRTATEVAAELGMSVGAVYIAKSRVIKRARQELAGLI